MRRQWSDGRVLPQARRKPRDPEATARRGSRVAGEGGRQRWLVQGRTSDEKGLEGGSVP